MADENKPAPIYVTRPSLPALEDFIPSLREIWDSKILTNGGPFHERFEQQLFEYLGVKQIALFAIATIGLVTALQALRITGEVITTPYSFVATAHSLLWNGIKPVFVDIDPHTLNLDPSKIEAAITPQTTAIMPVHVYGHPCDVDGIQAIADTYGLKVIYDAAHAFGVQCHCGSVLQHGDLAVLSFHATKVFTTFEGGAIVCQGEKSRQRINYLKNFGFADEVTVVSPGINGKMSELTQRSAYCNSSTLTRRWRNGRSSMNVIGRDLRMWPAYAARNQPGNALQLRLLSHSRAARLSLGARRVVPEVARARHLRAPILLSLDIRLSHVSWFAFGGARQLAGREKNGGTDTLPADLSGIAARSS